MVGSAIGSVTASIASLDALVIKDSVKTVAHLARPCKGGGLGG
jgi:hypothetical protein